MKKHPAAEKYKESKKHVLTARSAHAQYFVEYLKSPLLNFCKKLPIIQKIISE